MSRLHTIVDLVRHFTHAQRWFLLPLLLILVVAGALMVATSGLSWVSPLVYTLF